MKAAKIILFLALIGILVTSAPLRVASNTESSTPRSNLAVNINQNNWFNS